MRKLSSEDRNRVHLALKAAQATTTAPFELVIVPASDHYTLFPIVWASIAALLATGLLALVRPQLSIGLGFAVNAVLFVLLTLLGDWWPVRMRLVPRAAKRSAAGRLAHREFAVRVVAGTAGRIGVLLFVSLGERYAEILADRDIHKLVPEDTWDRIVADFVAAMRRAENADAFVAAINSCGQVLGAVLPRTGAIATAAPST
jgi:putative membrane protein